MIRDLFTARFPYTVGLRLRQIKFIRGVLDDHADLGPDHRSVMLRLILGLVLIAGSNAVCWPLIGILTAISARTKHPVLAVVGCPIVYGIAFLCCGVGMAMAGGKARAFFRWRARVWVEWLLAHGEMEGSAKSE